MVLSQSVVRDHNVHVSKRKQGCLNPTRLNTIEPEALRTQPVPDGRETGIRNDGVPAPIKYDTFRRGEFWSEKELKVTLDGRPVANDRYSRMEADAGQRRLLVLWRSNTVPDVVAKFAQARASYPFGGGKMARMRIVPAPGGQASSGQEGQLDWLVHCREVLMMQRDAPVMIEPDGRESDAADKASGGRPLQRSVEYVKPSVDSDVLIQDLFRQAMPHPTHEDKGTSILVAVV
ncbi:hypothetical protein B0H14DRAFT_3713349 [Mycena olivaceomarginata]|nr:hypothetical protein B0H14DRAFT_3713349 [Mycena olivaceomarginata]